MLSPSPLNFTPSQPQLVGTSASLPVTLTNTGDATLIIASIGLTGQNASEFTQSNTCGSLLAPDSSCTINVTFTPTANGGSGSATAALSVTDNAAGSPQTVPITGMVRNFSLTTTCTSLTVVPGQTAIYTVDLAPVNGFNQLVSLSCSGAPTLATCTVAPTSMTLDGSTTIRAQVTATTMHATNGLLFPFGRANGNLMAGLAGLAGIGGFAALVVLPGKRGVRPTRRLCGLIFLLCTLAALVTLPSCGGGGGGVDPPGTAPGTYPLTVTGTFQSPSETVVTESVSFNLVVK
jgi:trimeric autotransporter adhesin